MSVITSEQVMSLRSQTGAGVMDCKNALKESAGDLGKAVDLLRKKGLAGLAKRAGRLMKEGVVAVKVSPDAGTLSMVEINCETDFVAKNPEVRALAEELAGLMLTDASLTNPAENEKAKEKIQALAMKTGENMAIRRGTICRTAANTVVNYYIHSDLKKAAAVELSFDGDLNAAKNDLMALAKDLAMQSVAMSPKWLRREDAPADLVAKEREIYRAKMEKDEADAKALAAETGKPYKAKSPEGVEKMLEGRVNKFFQESCLLEQVSIRETKLSVAQVVKNRSDSLKGNIQVKRFDCYIVGVE
ncbi:MAG: translation elongation factor Ts [Elusimicrobia bacterium GWA2_56_46]|nr:MAG: translation elongation factor Ts [Elusimicrobia bacterium GWA2_56_46]OGR55266.1 MAG: translation elongation factor Ts [Elusimicrobia bacterium GWC2_56_31]HBB66926.1 translation elongation factor Ts [Elusimicrobiota bacterium]HBW22775.1 translation elongation factor Ts [Elusimicrobiota bacterium]